MTIDPQVIHDVIVYLTYHFGKALTAFIQRDSFLYWPFLLSAVVLALLVAVVAGRAGDREEKNSWTGTVREYLSGNVWWHASARADYRFYFANALVLPVIFAVLMFGDAHIVNLINNVLGRPLLPETRTPEPAGIAARITFTFMFFIAYDFGRFVAHSLLHDVPVLWEFHKVHHSAETLNPITTFRVHPVDLLVMAWVPVVMTGLATWTFNQFTVTRVTFYTYLGLHVILVVSNLIGTLRHTNVWLSYGPFWGKWFVSPAQHQLHHSYEERHIGCNRGFELAIWDRLYGTLYVPARKESFRMGLGDGTDGQWHTVWRMYWWPFRNAGRKLVAFLRRPVEPPPTLPSP